MANEKDLLARLDNLDDAALQQMIRSVAAAMGLGTFKTKMLTANPDMVRRKLEQTDPNEISRLLASLDEETLAALLASLGHTK